MSKLEKQNKLIIARLEVLMDENMIRGHRIVALEMQINDLKTKIEGYRSTIRELLDATE